MQFHKLNPVESGHLSQVQVIIKSQGSGFQVRPDAESFPSVFTHIRDWKGNGSSGVTKRKSIHRDTYESGIDFDTIKTSKGYSWRAAYGTAAIGLAAYGQSKLAMILHAKELGRRLREEQANVTINSLHPGSVKTNILRNIPGVFSAISDTLNRLWGKTIPQGAATQCYVALHPDVKGVSGEYFNDCRVSQPSAFGRDPELAKKLWDFTLELLKEIEK